MDSVGRVQCTDYILGTWAMAYGTQLVVGGLVVGAILVLFVDYTLLYSQSIPKTES